MNGSRAAAVPFCLPCWCSHVEPRPEARGSAARLPFGLMPTRALLATPLLKRAPLSPGWQPQRCGGVPGLVRERWLREGWMEGWLLQVIGTGFTSSSLTRFPSAQRGDNSLTPCRGLRRRQGAASRRASVPGRAQPGALRAQGTPRRPLQLPTRGRSARTPSRVPCRAAPFPPLPPAEGSRGHARRRRERAGDGHARGAGRESCEALRRAGGGTGTMDDLGEFPALPGGLRAVSPAAAFGRDPCRRLGLPAGPRPSRWPLGPAAPGLGTARPGPARPRLPDPGPCAGCGPQSPAARSPARGSDGSGLGRGRSAAAIRLQLKAAGCLCGRERNEAARRAEEGPSLYLCCSPEALPVRAIKSGSSKICL